MPDGTDAEAFAGEHVLLLGPPGVGKSTILNALLGRAAFSTSGTKAALESHSAHGATFCEARPLPPADLAATLAPLLGEARRLRVALVVAPESARQPFNSRTRRFVRDAVVALRAARLNLGGPSPEPRVGLVVTQCRPQLLVTMETLQPFETSLALEAGATFAAVVYTDTVQAVLPQAAPASAELLLACPVLRVEALPRKARVAPLVMRVDDSLAAAAPVRKIVRFAPPRPPSPPGAGSRLARESVRNWVASGGYQSAGSTGSAIERPAVGMHPSLPPSHPPSRPASCPPPAVVPDSVPSQSPPSQPEASGLGRMKAFRQRFRPAIVESAHPVVDTQAPPAAPNACPPAAPPPAPPHELRRRQAAPTLPSVHWHTPPTRAGAPAPPQADRLYLAMPTLGTERMNPSLDDGPDAARPPPAQPAGNGGGGGSGKGGGGGGGRVTGTKMEVGMPLPSSLLGRLVIAPRPVGLGMDAPTVGPDGGADVSAVPVPCEGLWPTCNAGAGGGLVRGDHVVVAGNPGAGKSTILNSLAGQTLFRSGVSLGEGLTKSLDSHDVNGVRLSDTPGLADACARAAAAGEIASVLRAGGRLKLVFVLTLEEGRLRPVDLQTMRTILDGIRGVGVDTTNGYGVLVNKCNGALLQLLKEDVDGRRVLEATIGVGSEFSFIAYSKLVPEASNVNNTMLSSERDGYMAFFAGAPTMTLPEGNDAVVNSVDYDERLVEVAKEIERLRTQLREAMELRKKKKRFPVQKAVALLSKLFLASSAFWEI